MSGPAKKTSGASRGSTISKKSQSIHVRHDSLDALRGLALAWMTVYHFSFDLNHFGHIHQDFYHDPLWTLQRTAIVSLFLFVAGFGQALAVQGGQSWRRFGRRWAQVVVCALLVSLGSWCMFPGSWISFGVLHGLALMLLLARAGLMIGVLRGLTPWLLGTVLILATPALNEWLRSAASGSLTGAMDSRWLNGIGIVTGKPITEDWVPLLPWFGVVLLGVGAGQQLPEQLLARPVGWAGQGLARIGRWSLSYYMLHQPVLFGLLIVCAWWHGN